MNDHSCPFRQIRGLFTAQWIRVYQAYSLEIASKALAAQTFRPPFKRGRMTWIKPSFSWMMYRAGWATKPGQERILAIDITRDGFEWALAHSSISHFDPSIHSDVQEWQSSVRTSPVRIQWDPERTLRLEALPWRTIQVGLEGSAVDAYLDQWIVRIEDVTDLSRRVGEFVAQDDMAGAEALRPAERPYPLPREIAEQIGCTLDT